MHLFMTTFTLLRTTLVTTVGGMLLFTPFAAGAASTRPSCELRVTTSEDDRLTIRDEGVMLVDVGEKVDIAWEGKNAKTAEGPRGEDIELTGSTTFTASTSETYSYEFRSGSRKATCSVDVNIVDASFSEDLYESKANKKPYLSGTAEGVTAVRVVITPADGEGKTYTTKETKVKNGKWRVKVSKKLSEGAYDLTLIGPKKLGSRDLADSTLVIGDKKTASVDTTLVVSAVPLLSGGVARANASIPLSYLQVSNIGNKPATVTGFMLKQNGRASTDGIIQLSTVDDKGLSRAASTGTRPFSKGVATAPANGTLLPGETKLFTIKAQVGSSVAVYAGSSLMIDVTGVETNGKVRANLPVKGTTWMFGY